MKTGDKVRVYPHGDPAKVAEGTVVLISENQRSIAVGFEDMPPFAFSRGPVAIHPEHGIVLLAYRSDLNSTGVPWGPWVELAGGGHYEIELNDEAEE